MKIVCMFHLAFSYRLLMSKSAVIVLCLQTYIIIIMYLYIASIKIYYDKSVYNIIEYNVLW